VSVRGLNRSVVVHKGVGGLHKGSERRSGFEVVLNVVALTTNTIVNISN
jgi:hypothetical protein